MSQQKQFLKCHHVTFLSVDFEKAFDRKDSIKSKFFNYMKSVMTHKPFRVQVNNNFAECFCLIKAIRQWSPLSVALFQIAFNINK